MCDEFIIKGKLQLKQSQKEKPEIENKEMDTGLDSTWTCVSSTTSLFMWKKGKAKLELIRECWTTRHLLKDKMRINIYLLTRGPYY